MATESELRDLLQHPDPEGRGTIDLESVLSRARRRRRPRVIAAQALGSVALVGVLVTAIGVSLPRPAEEAATIAQDTAAGSSETQSQPFADQDVLKMMDACGQTIDVASPGIWTATITDASVATDVVTAQVTLTADDADTPTEWGSTVGVVTVTRDAIVVAHATPADVATTVDEGPGYSATWQGTFLLETCDGAPLPAGGYELRGVVEVTTVDPEQRIERISSDPVTIGIG